MSLSFKPKSWRDYLDPNIAVPYLIIGTLSLFLLWVFLPVGLYDYVALFMQPQNPLREPTPFAPSFYFKDYELTPIRHYMLEGRILGKHEYTGDEDILASLAPFDMFFGWGPMSNRQIPKVLKVSITQRTAYPSSDELPDLGITYSEFTKHADNNHLIPSTPDIESRLRAAPIGSRFYLTGSFVEVRGDDIQPWKSSLHYGISGGVRNPSAGYKINCKIIYVTSFDLLDENLKK